MKATNKLTEDIIHLTRLYLSRIWEFGRFPLLSYEPFLLHQLREATKMKEKIKIVVQLNEVALKSLCKFRINGIDIALDLRNDVEEYVNVWLTGLEVNHAN